METRDDPTRRPRWFQACVRAAMNADPDASLAAPRLSRFADLTVRVGAPALAWMTERLFLGTGVRRPDDVVMCFFEVL